MSQSKFDFYENSEERLMEEEDFKEFKSRSTIVKRKKNVCVKASIASSVKVTVNRVFLNTLMSLS